MNSVSTRSPKKDVSNVPAIDWARLAAFLDGEGSISLVYTVHKDPKFQGRRSNEYIRLTIANTDPRLIDWLVATFGGKIRTRIYERNERWKTAYWWTSSCARAAELLRGCLPYFILKRERADIALAMQATMKRYGVKGVPDEIVAQRTVMVEQMHRLNAKGPQPVMKVAG